MSTDVTWFMAKEVTVGRAHPGEEIGLDTLTESGLTISNPDECLVIEGHPTELRQIAQRLLRQSSATDHNELTAKVRLAQQYATAQTVTTQKKTETLQAALDLALDLLGRQELR